MSMTLQEIEAAVAGRQANDLEAFAEWFEEFSADEWDKRIERAIQAGRFDAAGRRADADFEAGRCTPR